jgi:hypothetical protein
MMDTAGLSLAQASAFLDARQDSVMSWSSGRRSTPPGVIDELQDLVFRQQVAAQEAAAVILKKIKKCGLPETIEIGIAADDHEAQSLGWPAVSAHAAVVGMTLALLPRSFISRVAIVPRGSTAASAAAADQH